MLMWLLAFNIQLESWLGTRESKVANSSLALGLKLTMQITASLNLQKTNSLRTEITFLQHVGNATLCWTPNGWENILDSQAKNCVGFHIRMQIQKKRKSFLYKQGEWRLLCCNQ